MKQQHSVLLVVASLSFAAPTLLAHHGRGLAYDNTKQVTMKGKVSEVAWRNPHVRIFVDVKGEDGKVVTWALEGAGTANLAQQGYNRNTLKLGQEVTAVAIPARNGAPNGLIVQFLDAEGKEIWRRGNNPLD
jgi:hypothetical protein